MSTQITEVSTTKSYKAGNTSRGKINRWVEWESWGKIKRIFAEMNSVVFEVLQNNTILAKIC